MKTKLPVWRRALYLLASAAILPFVFSAALVLVGRKRAAHAKAVKASLLPVVPGGA